MHYAHLFVLLQQGYDSGPVVCYYHTDNFLIRFKNPFIYQVFEILLMHSKFSMPGALFTVVIMFYLFTSDRVIMRGLFLQVGMLVL